MTPRQLRLGILWRGAASASRPDERHQMAPLFDAFAELPVDLVPIPFEDERVAEARAQLAGVDGVLVWVNPIQDGADRANVDALLREVAARGRFVSADPSVILKMGTKEVLYTTRELGWGSDTAVYRSPEELAERLPERLAERGCLVVKQGRGNGGNGVFKVELLEPARGAPRDTPVRVRHAQLRDGSSEETTLGVVLDRCARLLAWSGCIVDQPFQDRLGEGMIRCYLSHGRVVGFCHQWPAGLLDLGAARRPPLPPSAMEAADAPAYQELRRLAEDDWVPSMARLLGLELDELPVIWDADFLYGPKDAGGRDTFVLCEINVSAVWPFPPTAAPTVAANALARARERL
ncbi:MAG TPA: Cj0069 family protein [Acidimicrobiales bacterium]|nr:Cj0069 family protein [Acidimicrobiales bacterium]